MPRIPVSKTYKLFIDGSFPRSESGRHFQLKDKNGNTVANLCLSSRKDLKAAQVAARKAAGGWQNRTAYNRAQILYRLAEILEARSEQFISELKLQGLGAAVAKQEVSVAVDRLVYYAGWCDKYGQVFSSVNPVAGSYLNFSNPEPMGVVAIVANHEGLLGLVSLLAPALAGGNTCIYLAPQRYSLTAVTFAEALATSDVPPGVVNILTGDEAELLPHISAHMDINAIVYTGTGLSTVKEIKSNCAKNVKRFIHWQCDWKKAESQGPYFILDLQETKTTWHPVEPAGGGIAGY